MHTNCLQRMCIVLWATLGILTACSTSKSGDKSLPLQTSGSQEQSRAGIQPSPPASQTIRSTDFANFTYPWVATLNKGPMKSFALRNGKHIGNDFPPLYLGYIVYGDATGDGTEEAMVTLGISVKGSGMPHVTYICALEDEYPKLLWAFSSGDRADGGLRRVYAENGELVTELYDPAGSKGTCCPTVFTRTCYKWLGNSFQQIGEKETLPNPEGHGSPIMPLCPPN